MCHEIEDLPSDARKQFVNFLDRKVNLSRVSVRDLKEMWLPCMRYYEDYDVYGLCLSLHGTTCGKSHGLSTDVKTLLLSIFNKNKEDAKAIERNVTNQSWLCITTRTYKPNTNSQTTYARSTPHVVAAIVYTMNVNCAFVHWLGVDQKVYPEDEVPFWTKKHLSLFLLICLFKLTTGIGQKLPGKVFLQVSNGSIGLATYYLDLGFKKMTNMSADNGFEQFKELSDNLEVAEKDYVTNEGEADLCFCDTQNFVYRKSLKESNSDNSTNVICIPTETETNRAKRCYDDNFFLQTKQQIAAMINGSGYGFAKHDPVSLKKLLERFKKERKKVWAAYPIVERFSSLADSSYLKSLHQQEEKLKNVIEKTTILKSLMEDEAAKKLKHFEQLNTKLANIQPSNITIYERLSFSPSQYFSRNQTMFMLNLMFRHNVHGECISILPSEYSLYAQSLAKFEKEKNTPQCENVIKILFRMLVKEKMMNLFDSKLIFILINVNENHWVVVVLINMDAMVKNLDNEMMAKRAKKEVPSYLSERDDVRSGYIYYDPFDETGKAKKELPTNLGVQALVNAVFSLRTMYLHHNPTEIISKKGVLKEEGIEWYFNEYFQPYEILHEKSDTITTSDNFKKFEFSEALLPSQQDDCNCGLASLCSTMIMSKFLIDEVDNSAEWLPVEGRNGDRNRLMIKVDVDDSRAISIKGDELPLFRHEVYYVIDECSKLMRTHKRKLLKDFNDVLQHSLYCPTLSTVDEIEFCATNQQNFQRVRNKLETSLAEKHLPIVMDTAQNQYESFFLSVAIVLASQKLITGEWKKTKTAKSLVLDWFQSRLDVFDRQGFCDLSKQSNCTESQLNLLKRQFGYNDSTKQKVVIGKGRIAELLRLPTEVFWNKDVLCLLTLLSGCLETPMILFCVGEKGEDGEPRSKTFHIESNGEKCKQANSIEVPPGKMNAWLFLQYTDDDATNDDATKTRYAILVKKWPVEDDNSENAWFQETNLGTTQRIESIVTQSQGEDRAAIFQAEKSKPTPKQQPIQLPGAAEKIEQGPSKVSQGKNPHKQKPRNLPTAAEKIKEAPSKDSQGQKPTTEMHSGKISPAIAETTTKSSQKQVKIADGTKMARGQISDSALVSDTEGTATRKRRRRKRRNKTPFSRKKKRKVVASAGEDKDSLDEKKTEQRKDDEPCELKTATITSFEEDKVARDPNGNFCCALDFCRQLDNKLDLHRPCKGKNFEQCNVCLRKGHIQCLKNRVRGRKGGVCIKCWHEHYESNTPGISKPKNRLVALNNMTANHLWFDNDNRTLEEMADSVKDKFYCKENPFLWNNVPKVTVNKTMTTDFNKHCQESFIKWGDKDDHWTDACTEDKRKRILANLHNKMANCRNCKDKKKRKLATWGKNTVGKKSQTEITRCLDCQDVIKEIKAYKNTWKDAIAILKKRYQTSVPGYIHSLQYESPEKIIAQCYSINEATKARIPAEIVVDCTWVVRTFGKECAAFLAMLGTSSDKNIPVKVKETEITMNKVVVKIKYDPGKVKENYDEPKLNVIYPTKLTEAQLEQRQHSGEPFRCLAADGTDFRLSEENVRKVLDNEYVDFIKEHYTSGGFAKVPVGRVRKNSNLKMRSDLYDPNAPAVTYKQGDEDLCVVKSFVSALHIAGFQDEACEINRQYELIKDTADTKANALSTTIHIARYVMPKCIQFKHFKRGEFDCTKLRKNQVFLGTIETEDGHCNHAVTLFRGHIYDSNEEHALKISKKGLNFCSSDGQDKAKFVCFAEGHLITCTKPGTSNLFEINKKNKV